MLKLMGAVIVALGLALANGAQAAVVIAGGLSLDKSTRAEFIEVAKRWAPKAIPAEAEDGYALTLGTATIDGAPFSVRARFSGVRDISTLQELELTAKGKSKSGDVQARYGMLSEFLVSPDDHRTLTLGDVTARLSVVNGKDVITFRTRPAEWVRYAVIGGLGLAGILFVYALCHQFIATIFVTVLLGGLSVAFGPASLFLFGPMWAYYLWGYTRKNRVYYQGDSGAAPDELAINPANGQPMVGGMGGMDVHGNTYGSNLNDPHQ